jgi:hypothetical protein
MRRLRTRASLAFALTLLVACTGEDEPTGAEDSAPAAEARPAAAPTVTEPAPEVALAAADEAAAEAAPEAEPATAEVSSARAEARAGDATGDGANDDGPDDDLPEYSAEQLEAAARHALGAASRVGEGTNDCETAYARLRALVTTIEQEAPGTVQALPPEDRFLAVCSGLPAEMQRCLVVEYAIEHEATCTELHEALDPATRARLDGLMHGDG